MASIFSPDDILGMHFVLQQAHDLIINQGGRQIVWVIDRFDEACIRLEASTLNSLRNFRDQNRVKGRLSYLLFTRHALARLRDPREFDEFHEIVVSNICWVGPMVARDARWMANQMAERHQVTFGEPAINLLIELSGGLPAFMKPACTALATGELLPGETAYVWLDRILALQSVQRNCQEMWDDLSSEEKNTLSAIAAGHSQEQLDAAILQYLRQTSLLTPKADNAAPESGLKIFSPIFVDHKGQICATTDLIAHLGQGQTLDEQGQKEQLDGLVKQLAAKFEQGSHTGVVIQAVEGQGYRLVEGKSNKIEPVRIVIDETKFQQQVKEIVDTDFFQNLQATAQQARRARSAERA
jgi:DNA-binding winged helix-turn-helix (wHTH) protein